MEGGSFFQWYKMINPPPSDFFSLNNYVYQWGLDTEFCTCLQSSDQASSQTEDRTLTFPPRCPCSPSRMSPLLSHLSVAETEQNKIKCSYLPLKSYTLLSGRESNRLASRQSVGMDNFSFRCSLRYLTIQQIYMTDIYIFRSISLPKYLTPNGAQL